MNPNADMQSISFLPGYVYYICEFTWLHDACVSMYTTKQNTYDSPRYASCARILCLLAVDPARANTWKTRKIYISAAHVNKGKTPQCAPHPQPIRHTPTKHTHTHNTPTPFANKRKRRKYRASVKLESSCVCVCVYKHFEQDARDRLFVVLGGDDDDGLKIYARRTRRFVDCWVPRKRARNKQRI